MPKVLFVFVWVGLSLALPQPGLVSPQTLVQDAPALVPNPGPPEPTKDGFILEEVVSVHKHVVIVVHSTATEEGAKRRALIRDTWLQPLNRSSPFAFSPEIRKSVSVWFGIPRDPQLSSVNELVESEGKIHGDILFINGANGFTVPSRHEEFSALLRWIRVAYFERYEFLLVTEDDSFVSISNLLTFLESHKATKFFYGGFVNSFTPAPSSYQHKYYAPFVQQGTIVLSTNVVELLSRELGHVKPLDHFDATIGHFLVPFTAGKPLHDSNFIGNLKNVYSSVESPIVINHVTPEICRSLSTPTIGKDGKITYPPLPTQVEELSTRSIFIDPFPQDQEPACDELSEGRCNFPSAKMMDAVPLV